MVRNLAETPGESTMLAKVPARPERHQYVEGVHTRTAKDGRVYRLCRVCDDRANAFPHRGFRTTPLTIRERSEHHRFDPSTTVVIRDARGHATPACLACGKAKRATEHGGLSNPLPALSPADPVPARLRALPSPPANGTKAAPVRVAPTKIAPPPAELTMVALAIDRLLALPDDLVDWRLRTRLTSARELVAVPVFPTLDVRLTPEVADAAEVPPDDNLVVSRAPTALPAAPAIVARGILAGIRNDRIRELVKRAAADGWEVGKTGSGHISIAKGKQRMILSTTSNDGRLGHNWGNVRATAKRAGLDVSGL
jgi:hypothetical protein